MSFFSFSLKSNAFYLNSYSFYPIIYTYMTPDNVNDTNKKVEKKESEAMEWLDDDNFDHYWYAEEEYNDYS